MEGGRNLLSGGYNGATLNARASASSCVAPRELSTVLRRADVFCGLDELSGQDPAFWSRVAENWRDGECAGSDGIPVGVVCWPERWKPWSMMEGCRVGEEQVKKTTAAVREEEKRAGTSSSRVR